MAVQWNDTFTIGVDMIDFQHKHLFIKVDNLLSTMAQRREKEEICSGIILLTEYTIRHFCTEEELMIKHNYNAYLEQEAGHTKFIDDIAELKRELETRGAAPLLLMRIQRELCSWLTKHIGNEDKKYGAFLKMRGYVV